MRGECFWLYPPGKNPGMPTEFFIPDPDRMSERVDRDGEISAWIYSVDNQRIPFMANEVVHFKLWNPWNWRRGVNPLKAMDYELSMDLNASRANLSMLRNGAVPDAILATDNPTLSEDQARAIKERWLKEHQGSRRRHTISVLGSGVKYQPVQMSPQDMEYFKMKRWTREAIFARFGIPLILSGATDEHSSLSGQDTREQMRNFWEGTITPILRFYEDKLDTDFFARHKLAPMTGKFNVDDVSTLLDFSSYIKVLTCRSKKVIELHLGIPAMIYEYVA
jgi:HK97 family phage portal protein